MKVEDYIASGVLEQFVLGTLPAEEAARVLHMAGLYPEVRQEISRIEDTLQEMAMQMAVKPSEQVWQQISSKISAQPKAVSGNKQSEKNRKIHYLQYGVAASFTLKLIAMIIAAYFWFNWKQTETQLEQLQGHYVRLEREAGQLSRALMDINQDDFQKILLAGETAGKQPTIYWNSKTLQLYVDPQHLPPTSGETQYQLWAMLNEKPVSLGVFDVREASALPQMIALEGTAGVGAFALTLEPRGGSASPGSAPLYQAAVE